MKPCARWQEGQHSRREGMKRIVLVLSLIFVVNSFAQVLHLQYCQNFSQNSLSFMFENCVNNNFRRIDQFTNTFSTFCSNFSRTGVQFQYQNCLNQNFREIQFELDTFLRDCRNNPFPGREIDQFFINCVNDNFRRIQWEL